MSSGVSGQLGFPEYQENAHSLMIYDGGPFSVGEGGSRSIEPDLLELVATYVQSANSPYTGEIAYDPSARVASIEDGVKTLRDKIDALNRTVDWRANMNTALSTAASTYGLSRLKSQVSDIVSTAGEQLDTQIDATFSKAKTQISTLLSEGSNAILPIVKSVLSEITQDNEAIDELVNNYEESHLPTHLRSVNRFAGIFFMAGAVHTSTFATGMAQLERDFDRQVNEYRLSINSDFRDKYLTLFASLLSAFIQSGVNLTQAEISDYLENYKQWLVSYVSDEGNKTQFVNMAAGEMGRLLSAEAQLDNSYAVVNTDAERLSIIAEQQQAARDIELDFLDANWPFDVMVKGSSVLAALNGAAMIPNRPSQAENTLTGAMSGASVGASTTGGNPIGIGIGAAVGAAIGYFQ